MLPLGCGVGAVLRTEHEPIPSVKVLLSLVAISFSWQVTLPYRSTFVIMLVDCPDDQIIRVFVGECVITSLDFHYTRHYGYIRLHTAAHVLLFLIPSITQAKAINH